MGACVSAEPDEEGKSRIEVDGDRCIACGACFDACEHKARDFVDDTERFFEESIERLENEETKFDKNSGMDVHMYIAVGSAYAGNGISITDAEKKADSLMYENKKQYKLKHGQVLR